MWVLWGSGVNLEVSFPHSASVSLKPLLCHSLMNVYFLIQDSSDLLRSSSEPSLLTQTVFRRFFLLTFINQYDFTSTLLTTLCIYFYVVMFLPCFSVRFLLSLLFPFSLSFPTCLSVGCWSSTSRGSVPWPSPNNTRRSHWTPFWTWGHYGEGENAYNGDTHTHTLTHTRVDSNTHIETPRH